MSKKIGYFFFSFLPFLLVFFLQTVASFFLLGILALVEFLAFHGSSTITFTDIYTDVFTQLISTEFSTYTMIIYGLVSIGVYGLWYYLQFRGNLCPKIKETVHPLMIAGIVIITPGVQYLSNYLVSFIAMFFPSWLEAYEQLIESAGMDEPLTFGLFLYTVILAPICEELVCRGVTLSSAKRCFPFWAANILQALLFGVLHMNMIQGSYAFCLGLVLGYICHKSGSIYYAILLHMLFNLWGTVIAPLLSSGDTVFAFIFWFVIGVVLTVAGILLFYIGTKKRDEKNAARTLAVEQN